MHSQRWWLGTTHGGNVRLGVGQCGEWVQSALVSSTWSDSHSLGHKSVAQDWIGRGGALVPGSVEIDEGRGGPAPALPLSLRPPSGVLSSAAQVLHVRRVPISWALQVYSPSKLSKSKSPSKVF
jgi:hypothetical protein